MTSLLKLSVLVSISSCIASTPIPITSSLPPNDPQYQIAITALQTCPILIKLKPDVAHSLTIDPPLVLIGKLSNGTCAAYHDRLRLIIINQDRHDSCPSLSTLIAYETLHYLGLSHPADPTHYKTVFDDVRNVMKACIPDSVGESRFPTFPSLSPFSRGQSQGPGIPSND